MKICAIDSTLFRQRLDKACRAALHDAVTFPCEETFHRASGKLDGLLHGVASVLMSLRLDSADPALMEEARRTVGHYRARLIETMDRVNPSPDEEDR